MPTNEFLDFELEIEAVAADTYRAQVTRSPAGEAQHIFQAPFAPAEITQLQAAFAPTARRSVMQSDQARRVGQRLFETIFQGEVLSCLRSSRQAAEARAGLRLRLALGDAPELAQWPWELLFDPARSQFLVLSQETPLVRHLPLPYPLQPLAVRPPLHMLVITACPTDLPPFDGNKEWELLNTHLRSLQQTQRITLQRADQGALEELQRLLRLHEFHIIHFVGHGGFDPVSQTGALVFEDVHGQSRLVTGHELGTLLHDQRSLRLVVLNACEGAQAALQNPFSGVAQGLLRQRIPSVLAMQWPITESAAEILAREFYTTLAGGAPVDTAVAHVRRAIFAAGHPVEWAAPVLFMRAPDGVLFDLQTASPPAAPAQPIVSPNPPSPTLPPPKPPWRQLAGIGAATLLVLFLILGAWLLWPWFVAQSPPLATPTADSVAGAAAETPATPTPIDTLPATAAVTLTATALPPLPTPTPLRVGVAEFKDCPAEVSSASLSEQLQPGSEPAIITALTAVQSAAAAFAQPDVDLAIWGSCSGDGQATYQIAAVLLGLGQGAEREIAEPEVISITWPVTDTTLPLAVLEGVILYHERRYDAAAAKLAEIEARWGSLLGISQQAQLRWLLGNAWLRHSEGRKGSREPFLRAELAYTTSLQLLTTSNNSQRLVHSWLLNNLGWTSSYLGDAAAVEARFAQAMQSTGYVWPSIGLCGARLRLLEFDTAREACDEAILQGGDFVAGYYWRARVNLEHCAERRFRESKTSAHACWENVIRDAHTARELSEAQSKYNPQLKERYLYYMYYVEGLAYCYHQERDQALLVLEQGLALRPDSQNAARLNEMIAGVHETQCK